MKFAYGAIALILSAAVLFLACQKAVVGAEVPPLPGVYYWKTTFSFTQQDRIAAQNAGIQQLFVRAFDVQWNPTQQAAIPVAPLRLPSYSDDDLHIHDLSITPVVFIDNKVFQNEVNLRVLATHIGDALVALEESIINNLATPDRPLEAHPNNYAYADSMRTIQSEQLAQQMLYWQIDCDWTPSTRDLYFQFLEKLQELFPKKNISATIRLHQYRDRKENGIPPVKKGLLMCYNMAPVQLANTQDAIFDLGLLSGYLQADPYPLSLEAALPIFHWGAAFQQDEFAGIVPAFTPNPPLADAKKPAAFHLIKSDTLIQQRLLRAGDLVRLDGADAEELAQAVELLRQKTEIKQLHFFDWQPAKLEPLHISQLITTFYNH